MSSDDSRLNICFACATIYEGKSGHLLVCPNCGRQIRLERYESVMGDVRGAIHYGWNYRLQYEHDLAETGAITTHYYLEQFEEIFNFIALAAASGIAGGVAYDVVKKVIASIADFVKQRGSQKQKSKVSALIDNREEMDKFLRYIDEYYTCFEDINAEVREAIFEEMIVDKISPTLERIMMSSNPDLDLDQIKEINPFSQEEMFKSMIEVRRDIDRRKKLGGTAFQGFWSDIGK